MALDEGLAPSEKNTKQLLWCNLGCLYCLLELQPLAAGYLLACEEISLYYYRTLLCDITDPLVI